jgi:hypothetical protein
MASDKEVKAPTPCTCGQPIDGASGRCRYCMAHYMRHRYANNTIERRKQSARIAAYKRLEQGIIIKEPCKLCGCVDVEMHHPDYNKPNDVVWLCGPCHDEMHVLERKVFQNRLICPNMGRGGQITGL